MKPEERVRIVASVEARVWTDLTSSINPVTLPHRQTELISSSS